MKYMYALGVSAALMIGCCAVQSQASTSNDIEQQIASVQRGVDLSMTLPIGVGDGSSTDLAAAEAWRDKYAIAETRVQDGIDNTDIALADGVS